jgi:hypothetical protein
LSWLYLARSLRSWNLCWFLLRTTFDWVWKSQRWLCWTRSSTIPSP